jgi:hypothetical protein
LCHQKRTHDLYDDCRWWYMIHTHIHDP